jgi:hypothetical protein
MRRLLAVLMLRSLPTWVQAAEQRIALVVGNAACKSAPLRNPLNDACAMTGALRAPGFEVIAIRSA